MRRPGRRGGSAKTSRRAAAVAIPGPGVETCAVDRRGKRREFSPAGARRDLGRAVGLGLEPRTRAARRRLERILARPPIARRPGREAMGGADLAVVARPSPDPARKASRSASRCRRHVRGLTGGQCRQMVLDRSGSLPAGVSGSSWIGTARNRSFIDVGDRRRREESRTGRLRRMVASC